MQVNDLGETSVLHMAVVVNEFVQSAISARISPFICQAQMMTSLAMHDFSISARPAEKDLNGLAPRSCKGDIGPTLPRALSAVPANLNSGS